MARPAKSTVDYFPCDCQPDIKFSATEKTFGNNGLIVTIKLQRILGMSPNHYVDISNITRKILFISEFSISETLVLEILEMLVNLEYLDKNLWEKSVIYSQDFINRISDAYRNRNTALMSKEEIYTLYGISDVRNGISDIGNPQTKLNKTKVNNKEKIYKKEKFKIPTLEEIKFYCSERNNGIDAQYFFDYYSSKGWLVGKTKMKDWRAAIRLWERNTKIEKREETNENVYNFD